MHFFKNISTLFVGAMLATSAAAELTKVTRNAPGDSVGPKRTRTIHRRAEACGQLSDHLDRRAARLRARDVEQGDWDHASGDDELETEGMSDCIGLAVTVDLPEGVEGYDRWLIHYEAEESGKLDEMKAEIDEAKANGGTNIGLVIVYPEPETQVPELRSSLQGDVDRVFSVAREILDGGEPDSESHPITTSFGLAISGEKDIVPMEEGEWMSEDERKQYDEEMNGDD